MIKKENYSPCCAQEGELFSLLRPRRRIILIVVPKKENYSSSCDKKENLAPGYRVTFWNLLTRVIFMRKNSRMQCLRQMSGWCWYEWGSGTSRTQESRKRIGLAMEELVFIIIFVLILT